MMQKHTEILLQSHVDVCGFPGVQVYYPAFESSQAVDNNAFEFHSNN